MSKRQYMFDKSKPYKCKCYWGQLYMLFHHGHITTIQLNNMTKKGQLQLELTKFKKPTGLPDELSTETKEVIQQFKQFKECEEKAKWLK